MAGDDLVVMLAGRDDLYPPELNGATRRWIAERILTYVRMGPPPSTIIEQDTIDKLTLAKDLAGRVDLTLAGLTAPPWNGSARNLDVRNLGRKVAYVALGVHPAELLRLDRIDYLRFIVKRRVFAALRMRDDVNAGGRTFKYPTPSPISSKVNEASKNYWAGLSAPDISTHPGRYPFVLSPAGRALDHPAQAIEKLFTSYSDAAKVNLFDCAGAATVVLTAALVEASSDPDMVTKALNDKTPTYLTLDHVLGSSVPAAAGVDGIGAPASMLLVSDVAAGDHVVVSVAFAWRAEVGATFALVTPYGEETVVVESVGAPGSGKVTLEHLNSPAKAWSRFVRLDPANPTVPPRLNAITDRTHEGLFEQLMIPVEDLQIGDHIYAVNHPLYRAGGIPGPWSGEHSIVMDAPVTRLDTVSLVGHELDAMPLLQAFDEKLLKEVNHYLDFMRGVVVKGQLPPPLPPPAPVDLATIVGADLIRTALRERFHQPATAAVTVVCRVQAHPTASPAYKVMSFEGTVGTVTIAPTDLFLMKLRTQGIEANDLVDWRVFLQFARDSTLPPPIEQQYVVWYVDDTKGGQLSSLSLYYTPAEHREGARQLEFKDVTRHLLTDAPGKVLVTRPKVVLDEDGSYVTMLQRIGAIPTAP